MLSLSSNISNASQCERDIEWQPSVNKEVETKPDKLDQLLPTTPKSRRAVVASPESLVSKAPKSSTRQKSIRKLKALNSPSASPNSKKGDISRSVSPPLVTRRFKPTDETLIKSDIPASMPDVPFSPTTQHTHPKDTVRLSMMHRADSMPSIPVSLSSPNHKRDDHKKSSKSNKSSKSGGNSSRKKKTKKNPSSKKTAAEEPSSPDTPSRACRKKMIALYNAKMKFEAPIYPGMGNNDSNTSNINDGAKEQVSAHQILNRKIDAENTTPQSYGTRTIACRRKLFGRVSSQPELKGGQRSGVTSALTNQRNQGPTKMKSLRRIFGGKASPSAPSSSFYASLSTGNRAGDG